MVDTLMVDTLGAIRYSKTCGVEEAGVGERAFDPAAFYARLEATSKERAALRQDLLRAVKDYHERLYGYDRYGAETVFLIGERMSQPYVFGFALLRILHDRRISFAVKEKAALLTLDVIDYGQDNGLPYGLYAALHFLAAHGRLPLTDLRYGLVATAGESQPFEGLDRPTVAGFFRALLATEEMSRPERLFWAHSLIARHRDGAADLINMLLGDTGFSQADRRELCWAWIHFRQPRLAVDVPAPGAGERDRFIDDHLPFWIAHAPSWPSGSMVRLALLWLARLGEDPLMLAETFIAYRDTYADQLHAGVADIIAEQYEVMPEARVRPIVEQGITMSSSIPTRRRFYRLGTDLYGLDYLTRATTDTANSVRQWAARQLQQHS